MTRRKLVAGNWKMNGTRASLAELEGIAAAAREHAGVDVAVALPFTLLPLASAEGVALGAQDVHAADAGAFTGCISAPMAKEAGAAFAIVGHSERRQGQCESDAEVRAKAQALQRAGMRAIVCVGETLEQRDAGAAIEIVTSQLTASLCPEATGEWLSVAYEPIWAIGTGKVATVEDVEAMHRAIRDELIELFGEEGGRGIRLLYGGSVTADNAGALLHAAEVDGALVGGASLTAAKFAPIVAAATDQP